MKHFLSALIFFISTSVLLAQNNSRIEVKGQIIVNVESLENITIYNTSSNKGTITDSIGNFKMKVALNDEIRVSSIQLIPFTTKITQAIIDTKVLKIYLKEYINTLDEVILLPYNLTGNLTADALNIKVSDPIIFNFSSFEDYEMPDDYHSKVENIAIGSQNDRIRYQLNGIAIVGELVNLIFKKKKDKKNNKGYKKEKLETPISRISEQFNALYFQENYNIPKNRVEAFISYIEATDFNFSLLEPKNELKLIEYFHAKSKTFLALKDEN